MDTRCAVSTNHTPAARIGEAPRRVDPDPNRRLCMRRRLACRNGRGPADVNRLSWLFAERALPACFSRIPATATGRAFTRQMSETRIARPG
jgi:hypothetical protein